MKPEIDRFVLICYRALLPLFFDVFRHRETVMRPFAPAISELYWRAEVSSRGGKSQFPRPPWHRRPPGGQAQGLRYTVTLSVDLRKSTLAMEQADDQRKFGEWLGELVESLTEICHENCGIFDKFTGDGGLMHFLDEECRQICEKPAVVAALECARDLRARIAKLLPRMREIMQNDSELFGAGISIASGDAYWDLDHRWNPIVVGRGVVNACRICDKTPPGRIRLANRTYHLLRAENLEEALPFSQVLLGGNKEHSDSQRLIAWELREGSSSSLPPAG
jgi:class 3 adenylate cyclase